MKFLLFLALLMPSMAVANDAQLETVVEAQEVEASDYASNYNLDQARRDILVLRANQRDIVAVINRQSRIINDLVSGNGRFNDRFDRYDSVFSDYDGRFRGYDDRIRALERGGRNPY